MIAGMRRTRRRERAPGLPRGPRSCYSAAVGGPARPAFPCQEDGVARVCDICTKGVQRGNKISHAHNVSRRVWNPNLQNVRALVNGRAQQMKVCTRCLKAGKVTKAVRKTKAA